VACPHKQHPEPTIVSILLTYLRPRKRDAQARHHHDHPATSKLFVSDDQSQTVHESVSGQAGRHPGMANEWDARRENLDADEMQRTSRKRAHVPKGIDIERELHCWRREPGEKFGATAVVAQMPPFQQVVVG